MFYTEEEMKIVEDFAWKNLDGLNHTYYPDLDNFPHFYYKNKMIFDPWMNEKNQFILWPDHEDPEIVVDPIEYYGEETINNFVKSMVLCRPWWNQEITEKTMRHCDENGHFEWESERNMPISVRFAMSDRQAEEEHVKVCIGEEFPESDRIYFMLERLPEDLVRVYRCSWEKEIRLLKKDVSKVMKLLYPNGVKWKYRKILDRIDGREVRIIGFGD